ncbi:hypothetical protein BLNAU_2197 [Blattamonas nauphoetae]|uniref:TPX2 central domain-containing protein n=1 Tax=Blattamonas nauphoetae TaxID=2049346 RepID=A0ABQ9YGQ5_9EUKA|nr:hypothetical protein BLNAU_2197 [Blattamonas nauphoetae]
MSSRLRNKPLPKKRQLELVASSFPFEQLPKPSPERPRQKLVMVTSPPGSSRQSSSVTAAALSKIPSLIQNGVDQNLQPFKKMKHRIAPTPIGPLSSSSSTITTSFPNFDEPLSTSHVSNESISSFVDSVIDHPALRSLTSEELMYVWGEYAQETFRKLPKLKSSNHFVDTNAIVQDDIEEIDGFDEQTSSDFDEVQDGEVGDSFDVLHSPPKSNHELPISPFIVTSPQAQKIAEQITSPPRKKPYSKQLPLPKIKKRKRKAPVKPFPSEPIRAQIVPDSPKEKRKYFKVNTQFLGIAPHTVRRQTGKEITPTPSSYTHRFHEEDYYYKRKKEKVGGFLLNPQPIPKPIPKKLVFPVFPKT